MITLLIIFGFLLFSFIFTLFLAKSFCGNMDKEYYEEKQAPTKEVLKENESKVITNIIGEVKDYEQI